MARSHGVSYFPFYFELLPTIEDLESDGFKISIFLRAVCEYASRFQKYDDALSDSNQIPLSVSGTARQAFRTFKAKIDPRLNAMKNQGLNSAANGSIGGRPRAPSRRHFLEDDFGEAYPQENLNRLSKPEQVSGLPIEKHVFPRKPEQVSKTRTGSKKPEQVKQVSDNLNRFPKPEQVSSKDQPDPSPSQKPEQVSKTRTGSKKPEQVKQVSENLNRVNRIEKKRSEDIALNNTDNVNSSDTINTNNSINHINVSESPSTVPDDGFFLADAQDDDTSSPHLEVADETDTQFEVPF